MCRRASHDHNHGATTTELLQVHPGDRGDRTIYATDVVDLDQRGYRLRARRAQHDEVIAGEVCVRVLYAGGWLKPTCDKWPDRQRVT